MADEIPTPQELEAQHATENEGAVRDTVQRIVAALRSAGGAYPVDVTTDGMRPATIAETTRRLAAAHWRATCESSFDQRDQSSVLVRTVRPAR